MDETNDRFAYRCLPLGMANSHGWLILNEKPFVAHWTGAIERNGVIVNSCDGEGRLLGGSHFGSGILTFSIDAVFRTDPGYDLMIVGPVNNPKDGIYPLTAIVESDWSPYTFTMNWKFTRPMSTITFEQGEPFCMIYPIKKNDIENVEPIFSSIEENEDLCREYKAFAEKREAFINELGVAGSNAQETRWQKDYFRGVTPLGKQNVCHKTKLSLRPFSNK